MQYFKSLTLLALSLGSFTAAAVAAPDLAEAGRRWWSHVEVLADDKLEGRNTGSAGYREAARYLAGEFEKAGLKPAGMTGYLQPVKFRSRVVVESQSSLTLVRGGKPEPLAIGDDAVIGARTGLPGQLDAPLVFVGYGLTVPEKDYDDLKNLDLKGKIVVHLAGGPASIPGALRAHYGRISERWEFLKRAGVVGVISVQNPKSMDIPWERGKLARFLPSMVLTDESLQDAPDLKFTMTMNPASMDKLLADSGYTFAEILALADAEKPLPKFALKPALRTRVALKTAEVEAPNVVGLLPGSDPKLSNEYIVISAHLDHLGVGEPIKGDKINNGAMDNATGIASLIEVARSLHETKTALRRSVLFIGVCGEEKGLLGSKYFANRPTVQPGRMVANLNFDMFLPLHPLRSLMVLGTDESTLSGPLKTVTAQAGVGLLADPEPNRNSFVRSDQYSFIRQGVPALAFKFGYEPGSPEEKLHKDWLKNNYHAPSDDLNQPVNLEGAARFNQIVLALTERIANQDERPRWNDNSFFRRFSQP